MKKNNMMRIASVLLVAVMLTSCVIAGTFAKYVTTDDGADEARVAKWGVTAAVTGGAFAKSYNADDQETELTVTVNSSTADKLVAPGTTGTFTGVALTGTPEVAVEITKTATITIDGWMIDHDKNSETATVFYCPLVFTIDGKTFNGYKYKDATTLVDDLTDAIQAGSGEYAPNTNLATIDSMNGNYTWAWDFADDTNTSDALDTILGDMVAAGGTATISIAVDVDVAQID